MFKNLLGNQMEISELIKKAEEFDLLKEMPFALIVFYLDTQDNNYKVIKVSDESPSFFGVKNFNEKNVYDVWSNIIHPDDISKIFNSASYLVIHENEEISFTCRIKTDNSNYRWVGGYVHQRNITPKDRFAYALFFNLEDLEDLDKNMWEHSLPANLILKDVLNTTSSKLLWKDVNLRYMGANKAFLDYYGLSSEKEIIGKTSEELAIKLNYSDINDSDSRVLKGEVIYNREEITFVNGKPRNILVNKCPMKEGGRIIGLVCSFEDITEYSKSKEELRKRAEYDQLTGILNRHSYFDKLKEFKDNYNSSKVDFSILSIDLDRFKEVNDFYGHEVGDALLVRICKEISKVIEPSDVFARIGGDEFNIISFATDKVDLDNKISAINNALSRINIVKGCAVKTQCSIGVATYSDFEDLEKLSYYADMMMYENKNIKKKNIAKVVE